jgi:hypothetical protein
MEVPWDFRQHLQGSEEVIALKYLKI